VFALGELGGAAQRMPPDATALRVPLRRWGPGSRNHALCVTRSDLLKWMYLSLANKKGG